MATYNGDAHVSPHGRKVRVWIEAPNVTAEVYITRAKAKTILESLDWILNPPARARARATVLTEPAECENCLNEGPPA